jgi:hypothetical protein
MPKRVLVLLAMLLLFEVFLVLVAPQVDLEDGAPSGYARPMAAEAFLSAVSAALSCRFANRLRQHYSNHSTLSPPGAHVIAAASVLRC